MVLLSCKEEPFHALHGAEQGKGQSISWPHMHTPLNGHRSFHDLSTPGQGLHASEWPGQCLAWPDTPKMSGNFQARLGMLRCRLGALLQTHPVAKTLSWGLISRLPCSLHVLSAHICSSLQVSPHAFPRHIQPRPISCSQLHRLPLQPVPPSSSAHPG